MRLFVVLGLLVLCAAAVLATPVAPNGISVISSGTRQFSNTSNGTINAQGGNVTEVVIDALSVTKVWQGFYGNVTGNIHLDDANNNTFYTWGNGTSLSGQVYASRNSSVLWTTVNCTNDTQRSAENTYLGVLTSDADSVTNTFNLTLHPSFLVAGRNVTNNSCYSTNVFVNGTAQTTSFYQILLSDNATNLVYSTIIAYHTYGFNSRLVDFQLLVGENEHPSNIGATPYYFFTELN